MSTDDYASAVTASKPNGKHYPLLPSIGSRPMPNALPPHRGDNMRHSHSKSLMGGPGNMMPNGPGGRGIVALSLDSKAISQYTGKNGEPRSTRNNALR